MKIAFREEDLYLLLCATVPYENRMKNLLMKALYFDEFKDPHEDHSYDVYDDCNIMDD